MRWVRLVHEMERSAAGIRWKLMSSGVEAISLECWC